MGDEERSAVEKRYGALATATQGLFLSACIEHVAGALERIAPLAAEVRNGCVKATVAMLRSPLPPDDDVAEAVTSDCDAIIDGGDSDVVNALVVACVQAIETVLDGEPVKLVMNNLDLAVSSSDPASNFRYRRIISISSSRRKTIRRSHAE